MKKIMLSTLVVAAMSVSAMSSANERMDFESPELPDEVHQTMSATLKRGARLDDGRMNAQLLEEEFEMAEAYIDEELLSDLDLDEIGNYTGPEDSAILEDK